VAWRLKSFLLMEIELMARAHVGGFPEAEGVM
jgi:hypothetical protein